MSEPLLAGHGEERIMMPYSQIKVNIKFVFRIFNSPMDTARNRLPARAKA
jgi:hypothetical protein